MFGLLGWQAKLGEYLIVITVVSGVAFGIYYKGGNDRENEMVAKQAIADRKQEDKYNLVAQKYEDLKNTRQQNHDTITKEITHIIDKPIYATVCVDDSGRMLINDALAGRAYSGKPDNSVQTTPATGR